MDYDENYKKVMAKADCEQKNYTRQATVPSYYISDGIMTIDIIKAFTSDLQGIEAVCAANVIKYICRWNHKNGLEDLRKAEWYLNYLITEIEEKYEQKYDKEI